MFHLSQAIIQTGHLWRWYRGVSCLPKLTITTVLKHSSPVDSITKVVHREFHSSKTKPLRLFRYFPLLGSSAVVGAYFSFLLLSDNEQTPEYYPSTLQATLIRRLPSNALSRLISLFAECPVPRVVRPFVYRTYAACFGCDLSEMKNPDLSTYTSLSDFFTRELAISCRPLDKRALLVSPSDGQLLHFGPVDRENGVLEQVKGVHYSLREFLGPAESISRPTSPSSILFQCVIYLGPGDCHQFFNPADWTASVRRHFPGKLLSVRPTLVSRLPALYTLNERAVYLGHWSHGFMSFAAVGALGVGGIRVPLDPSLTTNSRLQRHFGFRSSPVTCSELTLFENTPPLARGDALGEFRFGSTIVLVFEAPAGTKCCIRPGDHIRYGEALLTHEAD